MRRMAARPRVPAALREYLAAQGVELVSARAEGKTGGWHVTGQRWWPLDLPGRAAPLHVALPVQLDVRRAADGTLHADLAPPGAEELAEAAGFARSLVVHGQTGATARGGASHEIVADSAGRERLVRRRFSAR
jgi:hypothetical protein